MNALIERTKEILERNKKLHPNDDYGHYAVWEELTSLLSKDIYATIEVLEKLEADDVLWISAVFDDIFYETRNNDYIDCLRRLDFKFPELNLKPFIPDKD